MRLNAGALAGTVGQHPVGFQPTRCLAPPNPIDGLLELVLLNKIQRRQQE
jgi:hypothetical protein